jgi:hypothetical protein
MPLSQSNLIAPAQSIPRNDRKVVPAPGAGSSSRPPLIVTGAPLIIEEPPEIPPKAAPESGKRKAKVEEENAAASRAPASSPPRKQQKVAPASGTPCAADKADDRGKNSRPITPRVPVDTTADDPPRRVRQRALSPTLSDKDKATLARGLERGFVVREIGRAHV